MWYFCGMCSILERYKSQFLIIEAKGTMSYGSIIIIRRRLLLLLRHPLSYCNRQKRRHTVLPP